MAKSEKETEKKEEKPEDKKEKEAEETQETDDRGRKMWKATCAECGKECTVPFKPDQDRPVYCNECFKKKGRR